jgi:hypothetical protein
MLEKEVRTMEQDKHANRVKRIQWLADKKNIEKALGASQLVLEPIEMDLKKWETKLPSSLAKTLERQFEKLNQGSIRSVSQRLQTIIGLYSKIEGYHKSINRTKEVLKDNQGKIREVDVLYIGLAVGYALSVDGKMAGIGTPGLNGWQWQWRPQLAGQIKRAMNYYSHNQIADFVQLPVKLERE